MELERHRRYAFLCRSHFPHFRNIVYNEETPLAERSSRGGVGGGGLPGGDPRSASPLLKRKPGGGIADAAQGYASLQGSINDVSVAHLK